MSGIVVRDVRHCRLTDGVELSARIDGLAGRAGGTRLWFRFPAGLADQVQPGAEPFLAALLPIAMSAGQGLSAEVPVSPRFHRGLGQIARLYHSWDDRLALIRLDSREGVPAHSEAVGVGCFFTGGVDSFHTLLKNLEWARAGDRITHLIFIRGFADCPLENEPLFAGLQQRLRQAADSLGLQLICVETNLASFSVAPGVRWDWYAGSQLACAGLCLTPLLRVLYVPAGDTYSTLSAWGSHPLVDPLWSTETLEFRHDGCEAYRSWKLEQYVARSPLAMQCLRVCGYESTGVTNCGVCEKCLRTMIGLAALGVTPPTGLFAADLDLKLVRRLDGGDRVIGYYLRDNLSLLRGQGESSRPPGLEQALQAALRASPGRWLQRRLRGAAQEADRRLFGGDLRRLAVRLAGRQGGSPSELRMAPLRWLLREVAWAAARIARGAGRPQWGRRSP